MFQLIVAVISIALVAALAIASIFYGGDAFTKSSTKAQVTTLINQGQQIAGAAALYKTDFGTSPADGIVDDASILRGDSATNVPEYLANVPTGVKSTEGNWYIAGDVAQIKVNGTAATDLCSPEAGGEEYCADVGSDKYFQFAL